MHSFARTIHLMCTAALALCATAPRAQHSFGPAPAPEWIEHGLEIPLEGSDTAQVLDLDEALRKLAIPSVSLALVDGRALSWARAYGPGISTRTLYQAASLSKLVTAVA